MRVSCARVLCSALIAGLGACGHGGGTAPSQPGPSGPPVVTSGTDVVTYKNDLARTGQNLTETVLTPANVNASGFGKLRFLATDGKVDAQPLYLAALSVQGATHNVVFVATENDSVYAFDADSGALLWRVSLLGVGETPSGPHACSQITPLIGITSTPVIDRAAGSHGTLYVVAMSNSGADHQRLHALDLTTGAELLGGPRDITATYLAPGGGTRTSPSTSTTPASWSRSTGPRSCCCRRRTTRPAPRCRWMWWRPWPGRLPAWSSWTRRTPSSPAPAPRAR